MNINLMRNVVIEGQIATIRAQIETWLIYGERTGENVSSITTQLEDHITALRNLIRTV